MTNNEESLGRKQTAATKRKLSKASTGKNNSQYKDGRRSYREKVNAPKGKLVDHKDGNSKNNAKSNLKIMTHSTHNKKHHRELNFKKSGGRKKVPRGYVSKT